MVKVGSTPFSFTGSSSVGAGLVSARSTDLARNQNLESISGGSAERANTRLAPTNIPSSLRALGVMELLVQATEAGSQKPDNSDAFAKLEAEIKSGKCLTEAFANLNQNEQDKIEAKIGNGYLAELLSMSEETDEEVSFENFLSFGIQLKARNDFDQATLVLGALAQAPNMPQVFGEVPESIRNRALEQYQALVGEGDVGRRVEVLTSRFVKDTFDGKNIVPMIGATALGEIVGASLLGKFLTAGKWYSHPWIARAGAGVVSYGVETTAFAEFNRVVSNSDSPFLDDLARSGLSIGALKFCGMGGRYAAKGFSETAQFISQQAATFLGMAASHKIEELVHLRKAVAGETFVADTLSSMITMGVGGHLGVTALGERYQKFQNNLRIYTETVGAYRIRPPRTLPIRSRDTPRGFELAELGGVGRMRYAPTKENSFSNLRLKFILFSLQMFGVVGGIGEGGESGGTRKLETLASTSAFHLCEAVKGKAAHEVPEVVEDFRRMIEGKLSQLGDSAKTAFYKILTERMRALVVLQPRAHLVLQELHSPTPRATLELEEDLSQKPSLQRTRFADDLNRKDDSLKVGETPRHFLHLVRDLYRVTQETDGNYQYWTFRRQMKNQPRSKLFPRTITVQAILGREIPLAKVREAILSLLTDYHGTEHTYQRKGFKIELSPRVPKKIGKTKLARMQQLQPGERRKALRPMFPGGKAGARLFDHVEKAKRNVNMAMKLFESAHLHQPFSREAIFCVDLSHYEKLAGEGNMIALGLITRFAQFDHPDALPVLARLVEADPLVSSELRFLAAEGKTEAVRILGKAAKVQPAVREALEELKDDPRYTQSIGKAFKKGDWNKLSRLGPLAVGLSTFLASEHAQAMTQEARVFSPDLWRVMGDWISNPWIDGAILTMAASGLYYWFSRRQKAEQNRIEKKSLEEKRNPGSYRVSAEIPSDFSVPLEKGDKVLKRHPNGNPKELKFAIDRMIQGIFVSRKQRVLFHENGKLQKVVLTRNQELDGFKWMPGPLHLYDNGRIEAGMLAKSHEIAPGRKVDIGNFITLDRDGKLQKVKLSKKYSRTIAGIDIKGGETFWFGDPIEIPTNDAKGEVIIPLPKPFRITIANREFDASPPEELEEVGMDYPTKKDRGGAGGSGGMALLLGAGSALATFLDAEHAQAMTRVAETVVQHSASDLLTALGVAGVGALAAMAMIRGRGDGKLPIPELRFSNPDFDSINYANRGQVLNAIGNLTAAASGRFETVENIFGFYGALKQLERGLPENTLTNDPEIAGALNKVNQLFISGVLKQIGPNQLAEVVKINESLAYSDDEIIVYDVLVLIKDHHPHREMKKKAEQILEKLDVAAVNDFESPPLIDPKWGNTVYEDRSQVLEIAKQMLVASQGVFETPEAIVRFFANWVSFEESIPNLFCKDSEIFGVLEEINRQFEERVLPQIDRNDLKKILGMESQLRGSEDVVKFIDFLHIVKACHPDPSIKSEVLVLVQSGLEDRLESLHKDLEDKEDEEYLLEFHFDDVDFSNHEQFEAAYQRISDLSEVAEGSLEGKFLLLAAFVTFVSPSFEIIQQNPEVKQNVDRLEKLMKEKLFLVLTQKDMDAFEQRIMQGFKDDEAIHLSNFLQLIKIFHPAAEIKKRATLLINTYFPQRLNEGEFSNILDGLYKKHGSKIFWKMIREALEGGDEGEVRILVNKLMTSAAQPERKITFIKGIHYPYPIVRLYFYRFAKQHTNVENLEENYQELWAHERKTLARDLISTDPKIVEQAKKLSSFFWEWESSLKQKSLGAVDYNSLTDEDLREIYVKQGPEFFWTWIEEKINQRQHYLLARPIPLLIRFELESGSKTIFEKGIQHPYPVVRRAFYIHAQAGGFPQEPLAQNAASLWEMEKVYLQRDLNSQDYDIRTHAKNNLFFFEEWLNKKLLVKSPIGEGGGGMIS